MNIIQELQSQQPAVRYALFGLAFIAVVSLVGAVWFSSVQSEIATALGRPVPVEESGPLTRIRTATSALSARAGLFFGFEPEASSVKQDTEVHLLPLSQPR
jgi:hypothetical protein